MLNKLTFPTGGTETRYLWNKHQLNYSGEFIWGKYSAEIENRYYWDKYERQAPINTWDIYNTVANTDYYYWDAYAVKQQYEVETQYYKQYPKKYSYYAYIKQTGSSTPTITNSSGYFRNPNYEGWFRLFRLDMSYVDIYGGNNYYEEGMSMAINGFVGYGYGATWDKLPAGPTGLFLRNDVFLTANNGYMYLRAEEGGTYRAAINNGYVGQFGTSSTIPSGYSKAHQVTGINYPDYTQEYELASSAPSSTTDINSIVRHYYYGTVMMIVDIYGYVYIPVYSSDFVPDYNQKVGSYESSNINAYPNGYDEKEQLFYKRRKNNFTVYTKGTTITGSVSSYDNRDYPANDKTQFNNSKWYYLHNGYPYVWRKYDNYASTYEWKVYENWDKDIDSWGYTPLEISSYLFLKTAEVPLNLYLNNFTIPSTISTTSQFSGGTDLQSGPIILKFADGTNETIRANNNGFLVDYTDRKDIIGFLVPPGIEYIVKDVSTLQYVKGSTSGTGTVKGTFYQFGNNIVGYGTTPPDVEYKATYEATTVEITTIITTNNMGDYPLNGEGTDGAYYEYYGLHKRAYYVPLGDYTTITSGNKNDYPVYGIGNDNKFYVFNQLSGASAPYGSYTEVRAYNPTTYPEDGVQNGSYYVYVGEERVGDAKGDYIETVNSLNENAYPQNEPQGAYWYVFKEKTQSVVVGDFIEEVRDEEDLYPHNGVYEPDNCWYIYESFDVNGPFKSKYVSGTVDSNIRSAYPDDGILGSYWYDYQYDYEDYICHITNKNLKGGVKYKLDINPEADYMVGTVASAELSFDYDNSKDDFDKYIEYKYFDYYIQQAEDKDWRLIGRFWLDDYKYGKSTVAVKAYDAVVEKDVYIDEFIKNTNFPITLTDFFHSLCEFCGVVGVINGSLPNRTFAFADNFQAINITARQVFQYIAEMAGGFIIANSQGQLELRTYSTTGTTLDKTKYVSYTKSRYNTNGITGLTVRVNGDDLGVSSGDTEDNPYIIENNPLFYCQKESEISGAVSALRDALGGKVYTPAKITLLQDFGINCGDIITVNGDTIYVMKKNYDASGVTLECVGNEYREKEASNLNSEIIALRGKTNELYRDLEQTRSTITDVEAGLRSEITQTAERLTSEFIAKDSETGEDLKSLISQTAEEIRMEVSRTNSETEETLRSEYQQTAENITLTVENQGKSLSQLELRADSITSSVSNVAGELSEVKQTANSIESRVQGVEGQVSSIRQDLDGIDLSYSSSSGTASITVGNITVKVPSEDGVEDLVEERVGIEMNGYVQFVDLEEEGETTIHGGNITTGKVNADYLGLYGWMNVKQRYSGTSYVGNGGYIGYSTGDDGVNGTTEGIAVSASGGDSYFIATNSGARLTCGDNALTVMENKISATVAISTGSDERIKNTINHDLDRYEEFYKDLKPAYYKLNNGTSDRYHTGFIAQEVEEAINNNGITNQDFAGLIQIKGDADGILLAEYQDQYYLRYEEFIALNTYMIQKLMKRIDELEAEVNTLKGE